MRILFRTDANAQIGTGHLMRCLALADGLRAEGAECTFLCRAGGLGVMARRITEAGHVLLTLPDSPPSDADVDSPQLAHAGWLPGGQRNDATACLNALDGQPVANWLIVDHYALDQRWEKPMRVAAASILVIDDLADRQHACDLLLDQNQVPDMVARYENRGPGNCRLLLGPKYALLRNEFSRSEASAPAGERSTSPRLLVMFGGADPQNLTLRTVNALASVGWKAGVDVVAGPLYADLDNLQMAIAALPDVRLHAPAGDVATLMRSAGFAVGSPGVASWERCACALPSLTIAQADNQEPIGEALGISGAHCYLGRAEDVSDADLEAALHFWQNNGLARQAMTAAAQAICDGLGVRRVVRQLLKRSLSIRIASQDDARLLFVWRNDERTRRQSLDPRPLALATHLAWFDNMIRKADSSLLVACRDGVPVACIRFDCHENRARVSIYTDPELQGHGLGGAALAAGIDWLQAERPEVTVTEADVLPANRASHNLFSSAGFHPVWTRYEYSRESSCQG